MWTAPLPADPAAPVYQSCIRGIRDQDLKDRPEKATDSVARADLNYRRVGPTGACGGLPYADFELPEVTAKEMAWLYENKMVGKKAPGRRVYDAIRTASPQGRCPLCGHRDVTTVDHYLPKSAYAAVAVNPANLIPACGDCNQMKSDAVLDILHPYYDNVENDRWLAATVIEGNPPAFRFEVCAPDTWSAALAERARLHFATFALGALYAQQAARELSGIKFRLEGILSQQGADGVRLHVLENERSWRAARLNGWQSAFYGAGAASDWFCAGGFRF